MSWLRVRLPGALGVFLLCACRWEVFAEAAATAVDAVRGRFAGGPLRSEHVAIGVFAGFADAFAGLFIGFLSETRGDLESVEVDARVAAVDAAGGECAEDLVDCDLYSGGVFGGRKQEWIDRRGRGVGIAAGGGVEIAKGLPAEGGRFALVPAGKNMPAFVEHGRDSLTLLPRLFRQIPWNHRVREVIISLTDYSKSKIKATPEGWPPLPFTRL